MLRLTWYRFRATFGRRWGGFLGIVLLVGLVGGLAMGSIAAARRTQSAFPSYLASTHPSDLTLPTAGWQPGSPENAGADLSIARALARLPHVKRVENEFTINAQPLGSNGLPLAAPPAADAVGISVLNNDGSVDGELSDQDRLTALDGRLADPARPDEIVVSALIAQVLRLHVGEVMPIGFYTNAQTNLPGYGAGGGFKHKAHLRWT